jgi:ribokinase
MANPSLLVVGSSNTDMIVKVEHLPQPGETLLGGDFSTACGGKGANQAVGAARAGGAVTFIGRVGQDMFGEMALDAFRASHINTDYVIRDRSSPSGVALIFVAKTGQNSIAVAPGANSNLSPADVRKAKSAFRNVSVLLLQLETPLKTAQAATELANAAGVRVILNPAPAQMLPPSLLNGLYLLTPNEVETRLLTGITVEDESSAAVAANKLLAQGIQNTIITMGARGAFVAGNGTRRFLPAYKVDAVDATGAGDVFNGALAVAIAEGKPLLQAAAFANAAAAISVTRLGAQTSAPTRKEIEQLLATGKVQRFDPAPAHGPGGNGANGLSGFKPSGKPRKVLTAV